MGAGGSAALAPLRVSARDVRELLGALWDEEWWAHCQDSDGLVALSALQAHLQGLTDVFLTHNWGTDFGVDNHSRVSRVNAALKARGLRTWFDEEKMEGNVRKKMVAGIEGASCVAVFVTQRYIDKVGGDNTEDNCQLEFNFACRRKTARRMLAVLMEERLRDAAKWSGEVGLVLGGALYVDLSTEDHFEERVADLHARIVSLAPTTVESVLQDPRWHALIETKLSQLPTTETCRPASPAAVMALPDGQLGELSTWLVKELQLSLATARRYAQCLVDHDIGGVQKLSRRLSRDPRLLEAWGFDQDDVADILHALGLVPTAPASWEQMKIVMDLLAALDLRATAISGDSSALQMLLELRSLQRVGNVNALWPYGHPGWDAERSYSALSIAALRGHRALLNLLLQHPDISVNVRNEDCTTALSCATDDAIRDLLLARGAEVDCALADLQRLHLHRVCANGDCSVLAALAESGSIGKIHNVNAPLPFQHHAWAGAMPLSPLSIASVCGHAEAVRLLLLHPRLAVNAQDAEEEATALLYASTYGHLPVVELLLADARVDPTLRNKFGVSALWAALQRGEEAVVVRLVRDERMDLSEVDANSRRTLLIEATIKGSHSAVRALLASGHVDVNARSNMSQTALAYALDRGEEAIVSALAAEDSLAVNDEIASGRTALMMAVSRDRARDIEALRRHPRVDVNRADEDGFTALMLASGDGLLGALQALLDDPRTDLNVRNKFGATALIIACAAGHQEAVSVLVGDTRCDVTAVDKEGRTALDWARLGGHEEAAVALSRTTA